MKVCSLLLAQVCKGKDGANERAGGNHCIRVFSDVKGHYLGSSRADGNIKLSGTSSQFGHSSAPATQWEIEHNANAKEPIHQCLSPLRSGPWKLDNKRCQRWFACPRLAAAEGRELNEGQRGQKDNTEQMWDIKWDSPVDEGRILCFMAAVFVANSLAVAALSVSLVVHAAEISPCLLFLFFPTSAAQVWKWSKEKSINLLFLTVFSRSVRMRVEVDRERKASSSCRDATEKKNFKYLILTPIKARGRGDSCFKAWLFPLQLPIAYKVEYMLASSCNVENFLLVLFMIPKVSPLSCKQFIRQTFIPLISDWTRSTPGTHWRPDPRGGLENTQAMKA